MSGNIHDQNQDIAAIRAELQEIRELLEQVKQGVHCPYASIFAPHSLTQEEILDRLNPNKSQRNFTR